MKYLILGAGPAGLTVANRLRQKGITDFLVLERELTAGGLCRSIDVDGAPLDLGGGHFLDVRDPQVNNFLFDFMPEDEWNKYNRDSRIFVKEDFINHPFEANIWQMGIKEQVAYLKTIAMAGCNIGTEIPDKFVDWIYWKLGNKIAEDYMIPYNQKVYGKDLNQLGTYWLEKLPNVSFEETLYSCLERKAYGKQPGHAQFFYPKKYGYGELWRRMAETVKDNIEYNKAVKAIDFYNRIVTTHDDDKYKADLIVTTIPWLEFETFTGMPEEIEKPIAELKYSSIQVEYFADRLDTKAHWIYYPDLALSYHRILVRHNFCNKSNGYWTETNSDRVEMMGTYDNYKYMNQYAYPLNTIGKPVIMKKLLAWSCEQNILGLGRWGEHRHYNSDVTVKLALEMADRI